MKRLFVTIPLFAALAFTSASALWAAAPVIGDARVIDIAGQLDQMPLIIGTDPIITGPTQAIKVRGVMHLLDACDADCQARDLGLNFD